MTIQNKIELLKSHITNVKEFAPTNDAKIDFVDAMLKNGEFATLPEDYKEFLKITNGIIAQPYEFYGTENINRIENNYKFPNVVEVNNLFKETTNPLMKNRVVLGEKFFDIFVYDNYDNLYKILNRLNLSIIKIFKNFEEVLDNILEENYSC